MKRFKGEDGISRNILSFPVLCTQYVKNSKKLIIFPFLSTLEWTTIVATWTLEVKLEHRTGVNWIYRETPGKRKTNKDEVRTIVEGEPMSEAWLGLKLVPLQGHIICMIEIECILKLRFGLQLGSWV